MQQLMRPLWQDAAEGAQAVLHNMTFLNQKQRCNAVEFYAVITHFETSASCRRGVSFPALYRCCARGCRIAAWSAPLLPALLLPAQLQPQCWCCLAKRLLKAMINCTLLVRDHATQTAAPSMIALVWPATRKRLEMLPEQWV